MFGALCIIGFVVCLICGYKLLQSICEILTVQAYLDRDDYSQI